MDYAATIRPWINLKFEVDLFWQHALQSTISFPQAYANAIQTHQSRRRTGFLKFLQVGFVVGLTFIYYFRMFTFTVIQRLRLMAKAPPVT